MALNYSVSEIYNELLKKISDEVREASDSEEKLLALIEKYNLFGEEESYYYDSTNAKILIIGDLSFSADILYSLAKKEFNISRDKIVLKDYQEAKHFDYQSLKGYSEYTDIVIGPNAHKAEGIDGYSSAISMIQAEQENFPHLVIATDSTGKLKFTKTSLREALRKTRIISLYC